MRSKKRAATDEVTVTLIAPHRHAGRNREADEPITVRRSLLPTLEAMGVIAPGADTTGGEGASSDFAGTFDAPDDAETGADGTPSAEEGADGVADGHD